ncbi:NF-X1-type zinc finger protein NFXL1 [Rutidosis leptorrhynchoides]|uniref:NF-X1-type zinc finger protein NFXL1 n=1 Tax=Rutidosis leptorrhynchoides TaxID=125765 RepID=UPI003A98EEE2
MSSHVQNDRRENNNDANNNRRPRFPPRRQQWIARGGVTATTTIHPAVVPDVNANTFISSSRVASDSNGNGNGNVGLLPMPHSQNRGNLRRQHNHHHHHQQQQNMHNMNRVSNHNTSRDRRKDVSKSTTGGRGVGGGGSSSSLLPQLVQEIQEKLLKGTIECMICYDMVRRSAPIWSCSSCFSIFHLHCIRKWASAPTSIDLSAEKNQGFNWRCPGCQTVHFTSSKDMHYICFCGKRQDPPSDPYLTPHSCGEPCGRPLEKELPLVVSGSDFARRDDVCPHRCVLQCHPGPCPPCKAFAPPRICPCGKKTITTRCSDMKSLLTCGQPCGKLLSCQRHRCEKTCHVGPCDSCDLHIEASCFCNKKTEIVVCGDMAVKGQVNVQDGIFSCNFQCGKSLGCGNHVCKDTCHPGVCGDCQLLPEKVTTCYCGKSGLLEERHSCLDPIPTCSQICDKTLPCGLHRCKETCHPGSCAPCRVMVTQKCRCGSSSRNTECFNTIMDVDTFTCDKQCGRKKSCGRHRCSDKCCPLSNSKGNHQLTQGWDPHLCSKPCEKRLRCGQHDCVMLCHSGHCPPCQETIFTDLTCACGRSSIPPPLPCGTPPPSCQYPCSVSQPCGHVSSHSCHFGDCPPCSVPVPKECIGGHVVLRHIPCGSKDIRCNKLCGKTRQCGMHACLRTCHPAPCDSSGGESSSTSGAKVATSCGQTCGAPRRDCRHTCTSLCHPYNACPDVRCEFSVTIMCSCGRVTANVPCDAGGSNSSYNADTVLEASAIQKLPLPLQPVEANGKKIPLGQRKLMCDDECSKMERKKVLADAFGVNSNLETLHFGEGSAVSDTLGDLIRRDPKWVLSVEERCRMLVLGKGRGGPSALKVHVFCPMLKDKRDAVRLIAERWKLSIHAAGWEPKRFIVVHVTPKSKAPSRILGSKGLNPSNLIHAPAYDSLVDMDPRLVVALFDLPSDADVSALVLRFGGECELVWLNDKNALAVFSDPARAATAMRRLDHGSVYYGATTIVSSIGGTSTGSNVWGGCGSTAPTNPWKKAVVQEPSDSWSVAEELGSTEQSSWKAKEGPAVTSVSVNRWSILDSEVGQGSGRVGASNTVSENEPSSSSTTVADANGLNVAALKQDDVVEDWEKAYED